MSEITTYNFSLPTHLNNTKVKPSTSVAAQIVATAGGGGSYSDYYFYRRARFGKKPYFEIYKPERKLEGGTEYNSDFVQTEVFDIFDAHNRAITHQWVALEGTIVEIRGGGRQRAYNTKAEGDNSVRCQTVRATVKNFLTGETETIDSQNPLDFIPPSFTEYGKEGVYSHKLSDKGIELYGKLDSKYAERIKAYAETIQKLSQEEKNALDPYTQRLLDPEYVEAFTRTDRKCSECIANGWNRSYSINDGKVVEDKCSVRGELVFVVFRWGFLKKRELVWLDAKDLGISTIDGPVVVVLEGMNSTDNRFRGTNDKSIRVKPTQHWVPDQAKTWKDYHNQLFENFNGSLVGDMEWDLPYMPKSVMGVPTQIYLAEIDSMNSRDYTPLFYPAGDSRFLAEQGLGMTYHGLQRFNYEKALAEGAKVEESIQSSSPVPASLPTALNKPVDSEPEVEVEDEVVDQDLLKKAADFSGVASSSTVNNGAPQLDLGGVFSSTRSKKG